MRQRTRRHDGDVIHRPSKRPGVVPNPMGDPLVASGLLRKSGARLHPRARDRREFEPMDVHEIRGRFGQTRSQFASMMGISRETLRNWECGRRYPQGPARALLRIAAADPDVVAAVLAFNRAQWGKVNPFEGS